MILVGKFDRRATPSQTPRKIIASPYRDDTKDNFPEIDSILRDEFDNPYDSPITTANNNLYFFITFSFFDFPLDFFDLIQSFFSFFLVK